MYIHLAGLLADDARSGLHQFVSAYKIHPILVNFTAALVPTSIAADFFSRIFKKESLRDTGWWTLLLAACITPLTAAAGWLFWMDDDNGVTGMTIHKWLGTSLAALLIGLVLWRWRAFRKNRSPSFAYLFAGTVVVGALIYQGHLGGNQSFGSMDAENSAAPATTVPSPASTEPPPVGMPGMKMNRPAATEK